MLVNILWIIGFVVGLGIFGILPATFAALKVFAVVDEKGFYRVKTIKLFYQTYCQAFKKMLMPSLIMGGLYAVLFLDYLYFLNQIAVWSYLLIVLHGMMAILLALISLWFVYLSVNHANETKRETFKNAFLVTMAYPVSGVLQLTVFLLGFFLFWFNFNVFTIFLGISLPLLAFTLIAKYVIKKVKQSPVHATN